MNYLGFWMWITVVTVLGLPAAENTIGKAIIDSYRTCELIAVPVTNEE